MTKLKKLLYHIIRPWFLINLICGIIFAVQLGHLVESYIHPTVTNTWVEERALEEMEDFNIAHWNQQKLFFFILNELQ